MDKKTKEALFKIGRSIPKEWLKQGITKEKPFADQKRIFENIANDHNISKNIREEAKKALGNEKVYNSFERETTSVNPEINKKIQQFINTKVDNAIRNGEIKKAEKNDPFHKFVDSHTNR